MKGLVGLVSVPIQPPANSDGKNGNNAVLPQCRQFHLEENSIWDLVFCRKQEETERPYVMPYARAGSEWPEPEGLARAFVTSPD
ncbi:hypothetical protein DPEC_G00292210 [Dallia pectoralis]|uniref:Uncharacterized protein n=1 Tax=Dallia pectoralis TaxID=75939 RepID=A0ACC2FHY0_DALPE|nr:hypothetical protein DPEC_G00292210 [Dallia pectoralis]